MDDYQQVNLDTLEPIGEPGPVPAAFLGLDDATLSDLSWVGEPLHATYAGTGFWPVVASYPPLDHDTEALTGDVEVGAPNPATRTVPALYAKRALTPEEIAARHPPLSLGKLTFIGLVQQVGGMTDAMLSKARADANFDAFWIKFSMAESVERDHPVTQGALAALHGAGYMPGEPADVLQAWPTA